MRAHVRHLAELVGAAAASTWSFLAVVVVIAAWVAAWVVLDFSAAWHRLFDVLVTITMLLLIFGLAVAQRHSDRAVQLKLDELLRTDAQSRTELVKMEEQTDETLDNIDQEFRPIRGRPDDDPRPASVPRR